jgi:hypothetical protein
MEQVWRLFGAALPAPLSAPLHCLCQPAAETPTAKFFTRPQPVCCPLALPPTNDTLRSKHVFGQCRAARGGAPKQHCYNVVPAAAHGHGGAMSPLAAATPPPPARYALRLAVPKHSLAVIIYHGWLRQPNPQSPAHLPIYPSTDHPSAAPHSPDPPSALCICNVCHACPASDGYGPLLHRAPPPCASFASLSPQHNCVTQWPPDRPPSPPARLPNLAAFSPDCFASKTLSALCASPSRIPSVKPLWGPACPSDVPKGPTCGET